MRLLRIILPAAFLLGLCAAIAFLWIGRRRQAADNTGVRFVDVTRQAGIRYVFTIPGPRPLNILQTIGSGCAFLDYDHDGNLDILLIGSNLALYKGDGRRHFTDVTQAAGLDNLTGHFLGCAVGDYDNDGFPDMYLSGYRTGLLLHNQQGKTFRDVTRQAGLKPQPWGTACGFADLDGDGFLDLVVANYVRFSPQEKQICRFQGIATGCPPLTYYAEMPVLYHNLGSGHFRDDTKSSGMTQAHGRGLGIAFADYDNNGSQDILIANDSTPGDLLQNDGRGHFRNRGFLAGVAYGPGGNLHAGMGADWADYNGTGRLSAAVGTLTDQPKSLYRNQGNGLFQDVSPSAGLNAHQAPYVTFGVKWLDYDNDGWPDLALATGNVEDNIAQVTATPDRFHQYRTPMQIFRNQGASSPWGEVTFADVSAGMGPAFRRRLVGRGLAVGDFDNDGRADILVVDAEGPPLLLHNEGGRVGHWLGLTLTGTGRSSRDALGARVTVEAGGRTQVREVQTAGSYLSASDKRLLFGLGTAAASRVTVRWPDGRTEIWPHPAAGQYLALWEGRAGR